MVIKLVVVTPRLEDRDEIAPREIPKKYNNQFIEYKDSNYIGIYDFF